MANISHKTNKLIRLAVLVAIMIILEVTNIGYIKTPWGLELTIMQLPVLVGAIVLGPTSGAILGGVFGLTSFLQCVTGKSQFGATLLGINPFYAFIVCFVTRLLMGWLCGLIFAALNKIDKTKLVSFAVASLSGALLNTLFFMSALIFFFGNADIIVNMRGGMELFSFLAAFIGVQGVVEAVVCFLAGTVISKALHHYMPLRTA